MQGPLNAGRAEAEIASPTVGSIFVALYAQGDSARFRTPLIEADVGRTPYAFPPRISCPKARSTGCRCFCPAWPRQPARPFIF